MRDGELLSISPSPLLPFSPSPHLVSPAPRYSSCREFHRLEICTVPLGAEDDQE